MRPTRRRLALLESDRWPPFESALSHHARAPCRGPEAGEASEPDGPRRAPGTTGGAISAFVEAQDLFARPPPGAGSFAGRPSIAAYDFISVDTVALRRLWVLFFTHQGTRRVFLDGIATNPAWEWVTQCARNVPEDLSDAGLAVKYLLGDHPAAATGALNARR